MKKKLTGIITMFLPSILTSFFLRLLGHKIGKNFKIGFSALFVDFIEVGDNVRIGHLNLIINDKVYLSSKSIIGYLNILKGPFILRLKEKAAIGNRNYMTRGAKGISYGKSELELGELTKITIGHHIDLTRSVKFGDFSILAGIRSQLWTHGYYHADTGKDRIRIDGEINIGNNVYIGSGSIFNPGIKVSDAIHIGAGSIISKNLKESGMYVSQGLRYIENDLERVKSKLNEVEGVDLVERVYNKI